MKYKAKTKDCHLIVRAKTTAGENIDENALELFARLSLRGFLRPRLVKKNVIEYTGPVGVSLSERLRRAITKRDFLFIMEQLVVAVQKIWANKLFLNRMIMDIHYVYINEVTKELQLLYVPTVEEQKTAGMVALMESVIYSVVPASEKDAEAVSRFVYFLKGLKTFSPEAVERFIVGEDRTVVKTLKKQNAGQSGFMTSKPLHYYEHYDSEQAGAEQEEDTDLLEQEEDTALLNDNNEEDTELLEEESTQYASLTRVFTDETISITKPVFRIGKEKSYVDYFVSNNNAVSRSHADIITRSGRYFVIDLNSKNHTYINGTVIPVQSETELHDGDRLKLGNEEFIFQV